MAALEAPRKWCASVQKSSGGRPFNGIVRRLVSALEITNRYRTFVPRVVAAVVDGFVLLPLVYLADPEVYAPGNGFVAVVCSAVNYTASIAYSVLMHARYGQTLGKMAAHVRVMDLSESRLPSLRQAFLRDIGEVIINGGLLAELVMEVLNGTYGVRDPGVTSVLVLAGLMWATLAWTVLELLTMLTNAKRRAIHDYIAHTVVVRDV